jgi:hypothetical protein
VRAPLTSGAVVRTGLEKGAHGGNRQPAKPAGKQSPHRAAGGGP